MNKARLIKTDGSEQTIEQEEPFTLKQIYKLLDCTYVEHVTTSLGIMLFDEDGKLKKKPVNLKATAILSDAGGLSLDFIAGDVFITHDLE